MNPMSGEIKTVNSSTGYDREETASYRIGVTATDSNNGFIFKDCCQLDIQSDR